MSLDPAAGTLGLAGFAGTMLGGQEDAPIVTVGTGSPLSDPLLGAATNYALLGFGQPPSQATTMMSSPFAQALATWLNTKPADRETITEVYQMMSDASAALARGETPDFPLRGFLLDNVAAAIGMDFGQLIDAQKQYTVQADQIQRQMTQIAELQRKGQVGAYQDLYSLMSNLPDVSAAGIEAYKQQEKDRILRELNRSVDEQAQNALMQANYANYNPGRVLGDLEEARLRGTQDADLMALEYALNALGGQQNLAVSGSSLLQNYINAPTQTAAQLAAIRMGGGNVPAMQTVQQVQPSLFSQAYELSTNAAARQQQANTQSIQAAADLVGGIGGMMG